MKKRNIITLLCILVVIAAAAAIVKFTPVPQPAAASGKIALYTRNKPDAEITVAVIADGETKIVAYGHDGESIPVPERSYEIGQITRTFTGALAAEAVRDGLLSLDDSVSDFLTLSRGAYSPTVLELLTHSSAYSDYAPEVSGERSSNPYHGITGNDIVASMNSFRLSYKPPYMYSDSDYGAAVLGSVISKLYDVDFYSILTIFVQEKLGLEHTFVALEKCMENGWKWNTDDAYIASLGLTSDISDMVSYVKLYLAGALPVIEMASDPLYEVNAESSVGYMWTVSRMGWILSQAGETGHYSAAVKIDKNNKAAVVVLSNYPDDRYGNTMDIAGALLKEATSGG
ncbi:MAG: serine hydrolase [Eubacteriales bacterium]|nr:serine hydrolase [Eubacteriales bacterium]